MFVWIGKVFLPLVQPLGIAALLWVLAALAWWHRRPRWAAAGAILGIAAILAFASWPVGMAMLRALEDDYPPTLPAAAPTADAIVVLGGATFPPVPPRLEIDVDDGFDRLLHGLRLWRAGKAPWLILSGGAMPELDGSPVTEAASLRSLALEYGVPDTALVLEERSRTTRENALYVAEILRARGLRRVLLVTSASHMRRALGVFQALGIDAVPAPTDYRAVPAPLNPGRLLPRLDALEYSTWALKEYVGCWVYRARGWMR